MWPIWFQRKRWLVSLGIGLLLVLVIAAIARHRFLRIPALPLPTDVTFRTEKLVLTGKAVTVDFYLPPMADSAPVVVVALGFKRNRKTMAGQGGMLAKEGFITVLPDLPTWADHARNGRALTELLSEVRTEKWLQQLKPSSRAALVGFSAGGLSTLLAATGNTNVSCWVGLDPVGMGQMATAAAQSLDIPCFVLRAEPAPWNAGGNARQIFAALPGPAFVLVINHAIYVDAENPTSRAAEWACGKSDPARRDLFGHYLLASLRVGLRNDESAFRELTAGTNDTGVREVVFRKPESFLMANW